MKRRLFLLFLSGGLTFAASPETTISVAVTGPTDKPVSNAEVILDFLGSHQITKLGKRKITHWEVHTDEKGLAKFPPIPQGTVQLQVVAKNYQTFGDKFDVDTEQRLFAVKLKKPQSQYSAHDPLKPGDPEPK